MELQQQQSKLVYMVIWTILLVLVAWPLAFFVASIWVFLLPFEALIPVVRDLNGFLEKLITWPRTVGTAVVESQETFPNPLE